MFNSNNNKRVNLTGVFIKKPEEGLQEKNLFKKPEVSEQVNLTQPIKTVRGRKPKISKAFVAFSVFFATIAVAGVLVHNDKKTVSQQKKEVQLVPTRHFADLEPREQTLEGVSDTSRSEEIIDIKRQKIARNASISSKAANADTTSIYRSTTTKVEEPKEKIVKTQFKVRSVAYIYSKPTPGNRTGKSIRWKNSYEPFNALSEEHGFVYVSFTDERNKTLEGWIRKRDLMPVQSVFYESDLK